MRTRRRAAHARLHHLRGMTGRNLVREPHGTTPLRLLERTGPLGTRLLVPPGIVIDRCPGVHGEDRIVPANLRPRTAPRPAPAPRAGAPDRRRDTPC
ncbi:hypothetical protein [Streptomyces sp. NPDC014685]|uniref:hypothetical protein n=1 Tax=Streptomyces sp. NPDC014685 TaxID=3364881 RepID=UPI0036F59C44